MSDRGDLDDVRYTSDTHDTSDSDGRSGVDRGLDPLVLSHVLLPVAQEQPYSLLFATVSGAHLYGFPSPDSDYDLRGTHVLPVRKVLGLDATRDTLELAGVRAGVELDLVTHDLKKFLTLLLKPNGYVLEQLFSPLVVLTTPAHEELKALAKGCVTRRHSRHYLGFAESQWRLFEQERPRRVKPLLYVFRVVLTGIHLLRTGEVEANLCTLNQEFRLPYLDELIARKLAGPEQSTLGAEDVAFYAAEYQRLLAVLEEAALASPLPEEPSARGALNDFLVRVRLSPPSAR
jgi:predicted nucleotidyltransferase